jgi:hypothetical protein
MLLLGSQSNGLDFNQGVLGKGLDSKSRTSRESLATIGDKDYKNKQKEVNNKQKKKETKRRVKDVHCS